MRRAIQRCSASLPRTLASLSSSGTSGSRRVIRNDGIRSLERNKVLIRSIHQSPRSRQQAAATEEHGESQNESNGIVTRFEELGSKDLVHRNVVSTITRDMRLETMTEVQTKTINEALRGDDIIAQAKTGTGKTLAFLIPTLQRIINVDPELAQRSSNRRWKRTTADDIRAIIVSPTRELAEQIAVEANKVVHNTGVIVQTAVGGTQKRVGLANIQRQGCHILVGTPGRLKDILSDPYTRVEAPDLSALVFDEADRLLDQGFWPEIQEIMRLLPTPQEKDRQTLMFSATVPQEVVGLVRSTLKPGFQFVKCVRDDEDPTHAHVPQKVVTVNGLENAIPALVELCNKCVEAAKEPDGKPFKALVYFNSTAEATLAASALRALQEPGQANADAFGSRQARHPWHPTSILEIHGKLSQGQRTAAADAFRRADSAIMLSSDVTARGMDFPNVSHVIQVGLPTNRDQYVHRVGRTARAGKSGEAWLLINQLDVSEARTRLRDLPLQKDKSLETAPLDLTQEAQVPASAGRILQMFQKAMLRVPREDKHKVYRAQLGVYQWFSNKGVLIEKMNDLAKFGWGMREAPPIAPGLAQKLGLARVQGVNIGSDPVIDRPVRGMGGDREGGSFGRRGGFGGGRDGGFGGGRDGGFGGGRDGGFGGGRDGGFGSGRDAFGSGGRRDGFGSRGGEQRSASARRPMRERNDPFGA